MSPLEMKQCSNNNGKDQQEEKKFNQVDFFLQKVLSNSMSINILLFPVMLFRSLHVLLKAYRLGLFYI